MERTCEVFSASTGERLASLSSSLMTAAAAGAMVVLVAPEKEKRISAVRRAQMTLEAQDLTL